MPKRHDTHLKETIACRRFEAALSASLVSQPMHQGADYGTDYLVTVFSPEGELRRRFQTQVKYTPSPANRKSPRELERLWAALDGYHYIDIEPGVAMVRHQLSLEHLSDYTRSIPGTPPVLFVLANQQEFFYFWINDLYECYLRWLPQAARHKGTFTIEITNIRSLDRDLRDSSGSQALMPVHEEYALGEPTFLLKPYFGESFGWLGSWFTPQSVDSFSNLGFSLYVQNVSDRTGRLKAFDVLGFWQYLTSVRATVPYALFAFSRFIGLLIPTPDMVNWAASTVAESKSHFDLPVAFQILAGASTKESTDLGLRAITSRMPIRWWFDFVSTEVGNWMRLLNEYVMGVACFLGCAVVKRRSAEAQRVLIDLLLEFPSNLFPPHLDTANPLVSQIAALLEKELLIEDPSYVELKKVCGIVSGDSPGDAAKKVRIFDADQANEAERSI